MNAEATTKKAQNKVQAKAGKKAAVTVTALEDPYLPRKASAPWDQLPCSIYFYYVTAGLASAKHFYFTNGNKQIPYGSVEEEIKKLGRNAERTSGIASPPQYGENFKHVVWSRRSYFVIMFRDPVPLTAKALSFMPRAGHAKTNHTFYDAYQKIIDISASGAAKDRTTIIAINHMTGDDQGTPLGSEDFFNFDVSFTQPVPYRRTSVRYPNSGGTNMGPPVPPLIQ
jgi:hypothetical protein